MQYLIILAIFLVPISSIITIPGTIVWFPQLLALQMIGGICFSSMFWKLNKFLSIFLAYLFFSYIYVTSASQRPMMCLLIGCMAISVTLITSQIKDLKWIYRALIGMSILSIAYTLLQQFGRDPIFVSTGGRWEGVVSFMGSHDQLGIYSLANAFWNPWLIPLALVPIYYVKCYSALIGLIAGALLYGSYLYGYKRVGTFLFILMVLILPWGFKNKSGEIKERLKLWNLTLQQINSGRIDESGLDGRKSLIQASPLTGFGIGNFFSYSPMSQYKMWGLKETHIKSDVANYEQHFYEHAHNDLLEALDEFGYVGVAIVMLIIISVVWTFMASDKSLGIITTFASLIAQSVASFSVYVFHAPVSLFMFCLTLGLFYSEVNKNGTRTSEIKSIAKKIASWTKAFRRDDRRGNLPASVNNPIPEGHVFA